MSIHNICLHEQVDKKYTGCNLKTVELLDCVLIRVCAVIRLNTIYSFDPFKPHFYIVKLKFTRVYINFLISAQNIDCGYSLELPQSMF